MKKGFLAILLFTFIFQIEAQTRGIRIGYIDMEYILQNVPDYTEAKSQLEQKAQKWKQDIEAKKVEIAKLKDALKTEKALLTRELIEEREEEIAFQESELLDFQQKRFGPNGDLITQKAVLVKPIQDQVFTAVQDIAEAKKYDFIFDKSSDLTILFAKKAHNVSDQVIRALTRAERRQQLTKKQLKEEEKKEYEENLEDENPALAERRKKLDEKKAERDKLVEDRKAAADAKRKEQQDKRDAAAAEREAKKSGTVSANEDKEDSKEENKESIESKQDAAIKAREEKAAERAKIIEDRKKALEDKKQKILDDREAAKKTRDDKKNQPKDEPKKED